jgi:hypothetical protein
MKTLPFLKPMTMTTSTQTPDNFDYGLDEICSEAESPDRFDALEMNFPPCVVRQKPQPCGLFFAEKYLPNAIWVGEAPKITDIAINSAKNKESGFLLTDQLVRVIVVGQTVEYLRYKKRDENNPDVPEELSQLIIGSLEDNREIFEADRKRKEQGLKRWIDACKEYLFILLDNENKFLHRVPWKIRMRNSTMWDFKGNLEDFYRRMILIHNMRMLERSSDEEMKGRDNQWKSLCVFEWNVETGEVGEGKQTSPVMRVGAYTKPTNENFGAYFLGTKRNQEIMREVFTIYKSNAPALISHSQKLLSPSAATKVKALAPSSYQKPISELVRSFGLDPKDEKQAIIEIASRVLGRKISSSSEINNDEEYRLIMESLCEYYNAGF